MQTLTVVNTMLGTLGEAPLNALSDPHTFRGACLDMLDQHDAACQAKGWWFNREKLTITPNVGDSKLYLPGDVTNIIVPNRLDLVQRGQVLYDTVNGTNIFSESVDALIIRRIPFDELPELVSTYIGYKAIMQFQTQYDADHNKTKSLSALYTDARLEFNAEATRQSRYNVLDSNARLQHLKSRIRQARTIW